MISVGLHARESCGFCEFSRKFYKLRPNAAYLALTRAALRLTVSYRPPAPPVRLSAFSQVAFFAISDYALLLSMSSVSLGGRLAPGHREGSPERGLQAPEQLQEQ